MAVRYIVKPFTTSPFFGIVDCAKDEWAEEWTKSRFGGHEYVRYAFTHQEAAQFKADKLNAKENEDGE